MAEVQEKWLSKSSTTDEWCFELRVRYPPSSLKDLYNEDKVTFHYYYDQVFTFFFFFTMVKYIFITKMLMISG